MRPTLLASLLVLPLVLGLADPSAAKKKNKKPPACPPASYVLDVAEPLGPAGIPGFPDVIEVDGEGNVLVASSCPAVLGKVKGSRKGDKVSAKWGKEVCDQLGGKVKLKAKLDPSCTTLTGKFKAKKHKVKFTATRPPSVTPVLEPERRNAATIGREGGSVSAEGSNGVVYTLEIPEFALLGDTEVALTPVASIPDLPFSGGLAGSVEFEPDGLELLRMATLRIEVPGGFVPPEGTRLVGFGSQSGQSFHARFAADDAGAIAVPISHFSGGGAAAALPAELEALVSQVSGLREFFWATAASVVDDADVYGGFLVGWFDTQLRPRLEAAAESDHQLEQVVGLLLDWLTAGFVVAPDFDAEGTGAIDRLSQAISLAGTAFRAAIDRANAACQIDGAETDLDEARVALRWQRVAEGLFRTADLPEAVGAEFLDRETVLFDLCVQVVLQEVAFPDQPLVGEASILGVVATSTLPAITPIVVTATPIEGVVETQPVAKDVSLEPFEVPFTVAGAGRIQIDVEACLGEPGLQEVCDRESVVRGLRLLPPFAVLPPGDQQQFTAEIFGQPIANPVWTATGGSITQTGLYTAGSTPGDFVVTVSSVDHPGLEASAEVQVDAPREPYRSSFVNHFFKIGGSDDSEAFGFLGVGASSLVAGISSETSNFVAGPPGTLVTASGSGAVQVPDTSGLPENGSIQGLADINFSFTTLEPRGYTLQAEAAGTGLVVFCASGQACQITQAIGETGTLPAGVWNFVGRATGGAFPLEGGSYSFSLAVDPVE